MMNDLYQLVSMLECFNIKYTIHTFADYETPLEFYNSVGFYPEDATLPDYDTYVTFSDGNYFFNRFYFKNGQSDGFGIYE